MRYLLSVSPAETAVNEEERWAPAGEPVVPWYPATLVNVFLSVESFKQAPSAEVAECPHLDLDFLAKRLAKEYPGLPLTLHENYVLATAKAAHHFPVGTRLQVLIGQNQTRLKPVGKDDFYTLWEKQPL